MFFSEQMSKQTVIHIYQVVTHIYHEMLLSYVKKKKSIDTQHTMVDLKDVIVSGEK